MLENFHARSVGLFQNLRANHVLWCSISDHPMVDADEVRQVSRHPVQVMCRQDDRHTVLVEVCEQMKNVMPGGHIHATGGLVEQEQLRLAIEGAREEHALLLSTRQLSNLPVGQLRDVQPREHLHGTRFLSSIAPRQGEAPPVGRLSGHKDAFKNGDREIPVDCLELGNVRSPEILDLIDRAGHGPDDAKQQPQKSGLSRPRRSDDPGELIFMDVNVHVMQDCLVVVASIDSDQPDEFGADTGACHCG